MVFSNLLMQAVQDQTVGQEYAVGAIIRAVTLALGGLRRRGDVLGVLLFIGPPSSGKTHMARVLTRVLTGSERAMIHVNCQHLDQASDARASLEAQLTSGSYYHPMPTAGLIPASQVFVFEEIDKAPAAFRDDLALAIDSGVISTPDRAFPLHNSFVIMISDLSRKKADQLVGRTIGFFLDGEASAEISRRQAAALDETDNRLGARLVSRIDEIVVFERLNEQNIITLLERQLAGIESYLSRFYIGFIIEQEAKTFLLKEGVEDLNHGTRQITRVVRNYVEFPISDLILSRSLVPGATVAVKYQPPSRFLNFVIMIPSPAGRELPVERGLGRAGVLAACAF